MSWSERFPYHYRSPFFTGREDLLASLSHRFREHATLALTGLSGIGKTQIAIEYSSQYAGEYEAIQWLDASSQETLGRSLSTLLELKTRVREDQLYSAFGAWLSAQRNWLIVFDQLFDLSLLERLIPSGSNENHLLITARGQATGTCAYAIPVAPLSNEASTLFLLHRAGLLAAEASLEQASPADAQVARALAEKLDGVPLVLDQVGALLQETSRDPNEYLMLSEHERARILSTRGRVLDDLHMDSFGKTIEQIVRHLDSEARELLRLCACCFPNVPHELPEALPLWNRSLRALTDPLVFNGARAELLQVSLLSPHSRTRRVHLYGVVRTIVLSLLTPEQQRTYERLATSLFPK